MSKVPIANKDLGQHYLKDKKVISLICNDYANECDVIVEVGPGPATLTKDLASHGKDLYLIEKDTRFKDILSECTEKIYFEDALKFNWEKFIQENQLETKKIWLVSNLPYNISSALFISFIQIKQIQFMSLMFQKEVGEKTHHRENIKNQMSSLLSLSQNYFETKSLCKVLPGAFHPPPKVDSIVISYCRRNNPRIALDQFKKFESFLRTLYAYKRKQIGSVLKSYLKKQESLFEDVQIAKERRAETLLLEEVYSLYDQITCN